MKIACKEADETDYFLELCEKSSNYPSPAELRENLIVIIKVLSKIITNSKK